MMCSVKDSEEMYEKKEHTDVEKVPESQPSSDTLRIQVEETGSQEYALLKTGTKSEESRICRKSPSGGDLSPRLLRQQHVFEILEQSNPQSECHRQRVSLSPSQHHALLSPSRRVHSMQQMNRSRSGNSSPSGRSALKRSSEAVDRLTVDSIAPPCKSLPVSPFLRRHHGYSYGSSSETNIHAAVGKATVSSDPLLTRSVNQHGHKEAFTSQEEAQQLGELDVQGVCGPPLVVQGVVDCSENSRLASILENLPHAEIYQKRVKRNNSREAMLQAQATGGSSSSKSGDEQPHAHQNRSPSSSLTDASSIGGSVSGHGGVPSVSSPANFKKILRDRYFSSQRGSSSSSGGSYEAQIDLTSESFSRIREPVRSESEEALSPRKPDDNVSSPLHSCYPDTPNALPHTPSGGGVGVGGSAFKPAGYHQRAPTLTLHPSVESIDAVIHRNCRIESSSSSISYMSGLDWESDPFSPAPPSASASPVPSPQPTGISLQHSPRTSLHPPWPHLPAPRHPPPAYLAPPAHHPHLPPPAAMSPLLSSVSPRGRRKMFFDGSPGHATGSVLGAIRVRCSGVAGNELPPGPSADAALVRQCQSAPQTPHTSPRHLPPRFVFPPPNLVMHQYHHNARIMGEGEGGQVMGAGLGVFPKEKDAGHLNPASPDPSAASPAGSGSSPGGSVGGGDIGGSGGPESRCHVCRVCGRKFTRSDMLARHARLHTGHKPYECGVCGQAFSRSDHLNTHMRTHTGEKPYQCPACSYSACRRDMITRHMRVHKRRGIVCSFSGGLLSSRRDDGRSEGGGGFRPRAFAWRTGATTGNRGNHYHSFPDPRSSRSSSLAAEGIEPRSASFSVGEADVALGPLNLSPGRRGANEVLTSSTSSETEPPLLAREMDASHEEMSVYQSSSWHKPTPDFRDSMA